MFFEKTQICSLERNVFGEYMNLLFENDSFLGECRQGVGRQAVGRQQGWIANRGGSPGVGRHAPTCKVNGLQVAKIFYPFRILISIPAISDIFKTARRRNRLIGQVDVIQTQLCSSGP